MRSIIFALLIAASTADAKDLGQWEGADTSIRDWYETLMQPQNPLVSCCGEADAIEADYWTTNTDGSVDAEVTNGRGVLLEGTTIHIPRRTIVLGRRNPTGHSIIFYSREQGVYCFVPAPLG